MIASLPGSRGFLTLTGLRALKREGRRVPAFAGFPSAKRKFVVQRHRCRVLQPVEPVVPSGHVYRAGFFPCGEQAQFQDVLGGAGVRGTASSSVVVKSDAMGCSPVPVRASWSLSP